jgi:putative oxidoreductase
MTLTLKSNIGLALLRILPAAFMLAHGIPKLQKMIGGDFGFADPIGIGAAPTLFLAVIAEVVCPILIIIGFKTRWSAVLPAVTMLVAGLLVHGADPFAKKEMALLYLVIFIAVIFLGPGKYSIDKK